MPGAYAHITLINEARVMAGNSMDVPVVVKIASSDYLNYCELGGVAPDYPYLDVLNGNAAAWADLMHYTHSTDMIRSGVQHIWDLQGSQKTKCLAWLLGYAAHVAADVTVHPIVELKVGPYADNKTDHRICEMHQDAYIYQRLGLSKVGLSEHFDSQNNGIMACHRSGDPQRIDAAIHDLWNAMLLDVYPTHHSDNPPDIDSWHAHFGPLVDTIEEGNALPAFARHVAVNAGLTYPDEEDINTAEFITALKTPEGFMTYDEIFDKACVNVVDLWAQIGNDVNAGEIDQLANLEAWNLDTGRDQNETLIYWNE